MLLGFKTTAVSAPLIVPPTAIASSHVSIKPASAAIQEISQATFTPCPKVRRTFATRPSTWIVANFLLTARPMVPKAWAVVRIFALFFSMMVRFSGCSSWWSGFLKPVTWDTMIRLKLLKSLDALAPVSPDVVATMMFLMPSSLARFFASLRVSSVFSGPGFSKYVVLHMVFGMLGSSNQFLTFVE